MAKLKYDPDTFPLIAEGLARDGFSDKEISQQLGIHRDTYYKYLIKYPDFSDAIKKGRVPVTIEIENAFISRCIGYEYEEVTSSAKLLPGKGKNNKDKVVEKQIKRTTKQVLPHVGACEFWLRTKKPEVYKEKKLGIKFEGFKSFADLMLAISEKEEKERKK